MHFSVTRPMPFEARVDVVRERELHHVVNAVERAMLLAEEIALAYFGRWNVERIKRSTWTDERGLVWYAVSYDAAPFWLANIDAASARFWWVTSSLRSTGAYR